VGRSTGVCAGRLPRWCALRGAALLLSCGGLAAADVPLAPLSAVPGAVSYTSRCFSVCLAGARVGHVPLALFGLRSGLWWVTRLPASTSTRCGGGTPCRCPPAGARRERRGSKRQRAAGDATEALADDARRPRADVRREDASSTVLSQTRCLCQRPPLPWRRASTRPVVGGGRAQACALYPSVVVTLFIPTLPPGAPTSRHPPPGVSTSPLRAPTSTPAPRPHRPAPQWRVPRAATLHAGRVVGPRGPSGRAGHAGSGADAHLARVRCEAG